MSIRHKDLRNFYLGSINRKGITCSGEQRYHRDGQSLTSSRDCSPDVEQDAGSIPAPDPKKMAYLVGFSLSNPLPTGYVSKLLSHNVLERHIFFVFLKNNLRNLLFLLDLFFALVGFRFSSYIIYRKLREITLQKRIWK